MLAVLGVPARDLVRAKEADAQGLDLTSPDESIIEAIAGHPTLMQRPVALFRGRAIIARPETLLPEFLGVEAS